MAVQYTARSPYVLGSLDDTLLPASGLATLLSVGPVAGRLFSVDTTIEAVSGAVTVTLLTTWTTPRGTPAEYHWYDAATVSGVVGQLSLGIEALVTSANPITLQAAAATSGQVYVGATITRRR